MECPVCLFINVQYKIQTYRETEKANERVQCNSNDADNIIDNDYDNGKQSMFVHMSWASDRTTETIYIYNKC